MDKEQAIDLLDNLIGMIEDNQDNDYDTAFRMAIEALKAQLSQKGTTSDLIRRTETVEHLRRVLEATVPNTDYDEGYIDGIEFGISTVSTMPTIQPQSTAGQLNDGVWSTARSTDLIDRQQAIDGKISIQRANGVEIYSDEAVPVEYLKRLPTIQPELDSETLIRTIETGITATNSNDAYSLGMRNGMRWCKSLIDGVEPKFEDVTDSAELLSAQPEPKEGHWIPVHPIQSDDPGAYMCSKCKTGMWEIRPSAYHYCPNCGAKMTISTK